MTKLQLYRPLSDAEPNMAEDSATGQFYWAADADAEIEALIRERHQLRNELTAARLEGEQSRAALKVAQQAILEFSHAQECGPSWYTRGENGMYQQVSLWLRRGLEAVRNALGPYDDNGQYLKEKPAHEPEAGPGASPSHSLIALYAGCLCEWCKSERAKSALKSSAPLSHIADCQCKNPWTDTFYEVGKCPLHGAKSGEQQDVNPGSHKAAEVSQPENATPPRALLRPDNDWADVKSGLPDNTL